MKRKIRNIVKYILQLILIKSINRTCKNKGLIKIREKRIVKIQGENVYIFEFCPNDWELVFKHSGWKVLKSEINREFSYFNPLKFFLKLITHEGFMGYILVKRQQIFKPI